MNSPRFSIVTPTLTPTVALALALLLGACAATPDPARITDAASAPLNDLNLVRAPIPAALADAQKAPYATPADTGCAALAAQVRSLDEVLGADLDAPPTAANPGLIERGTTAVGDAAVGALRSTAEGLVPYRGWVRKLSGAERYSKEVAAAIAAGTVRRAFLKGMGNARGCVAGAAAAVPAGAASGAPLTAQRPKAGAAMPRYVAFLRAVNVGGRIVKMVELAQHFRMLGHTDVQTFIASGNVIFRSRARSAGALGRSPASGR